jgi:dUTP pyrophosphatase
MIKFKRLTQTAQIPKRATDGAAGFDLHSDIDSFEIHAGEHVVVNTNIACEIPDGYSGKIEPRSGWARKYKLDILGGRVDSDYRGSLLVMLINHGERPLQIYRGDRIAQIVVHPFMQESCEVDELDDTGRGENGFGSTGIK